MPIAGWSMLVNCCRDSETFTKSSVQDNILEAIPGPYTSIMISYAPRLHSYGALYLYSYPLPLPLSLTPLLSVPMLLSLLQLLLLPPSSSLWLSVTLSLPPSVQRAAETFPVSGSWQIGWAGRTAQRR